VNPIGRNILKSIAPQDIQVSTINRGKKPYSVGLKAKGMYYFTVTSTANFKRNPT